MNKFLFSILFLATSCNTGNLKVIADLPIDLNEVSGLTVDQKNNVFWMINDSGNKSILYGLDKNGNIIREIFIHAKNRDWEDLTTDIYGNIYIGDFGNNDNDSKGLAILKIAKDSLNNKTIIPERISFTYPEQKKFPPKKSKRHFDCESFFFYKDSLYLFTKSRVSKKKGRTNLYQLPTKKGRYKAKLLSSFNTCEESECWVTSADINKEGNKIALLTEGNVFIFSDFKNNKFFNGNVTRYNFNHNSQKESVFFKNDSTLYIADEYLGIHGGNLYEFSLTPKSKN